MESLVKSVDVIGIPLFGEGINAAGNLVVDNCLNLPKNNFCISATGAHGMVYASKNDVFKKILQSFYLNLPDGMPGVWVGRLKGAKKMKRCPGPDFFRHVMEITSEQPIKHFFCGGNSGVAEELKKAVKKKFNNDNVAGTYCPPFLPIDKYDYEGIARMVDETNCNILWIGLSTPKQELFASRLASLTNVNFIICVGAAFDFHTDRLLKAPALIQIAGLEWLFRLIIEPRRLFRRYFEVVPMFIYYNLREFLTFAPRK